MAIGATRPWDAADHLETQEDVVAYLEAAFEDGDPALIAAALGDIARAKGMSQIAREAGLGRESLYKALSPEGNPELPPSSRWCMHWACACMRGLRCSRQRAEFISDVVTGPFVACFMTCRS